LILLGGAVTRSAQQRRGGWPELSPTVARDTHGVSGPASYAVVVLAGGTSRRMGGGDKTALDLGAGRSVLDHLVGSLDGTVPVVVVGDSRPLERPVQWTRESPTGGGPLAGVAAGLAALTGSATWVVVIAGDQPFAAEAVPPLLAAATAQPEGVDAVVGVDGAGRDQPLLAAYRRATLSTLLTEPLAEPAAGRSMHSLLDQLEVHRIELVGQALLDIDDSEALAAARAAVSRQPVPGSGRPGGIPPARSPRS
jgi:molybdopterin-guanine dinucleotide biosynthesis protein A